MKAEVRFKNFDSFERTATEVCENRHFDIKKSVVNNEIKGSARVGNHLVTHCSFVDDCFVDHVYENSKRLLDDEKSSSSNSTDEKGDDADDETPQEELQQSVPKK